VRRAWHQPAAEPSIRSAEPGRVASGRIEYAFVEGDSGAGAGGGGRSPAASPAPAQTGAQPERLRGLSAPARGAGAARRGQPATIASVFPTSSTAPAPSSSTGPSPAAGPGSNANPPFAPYRARHVTPALIAGGQRRYAANLPGCSEIGRRYGVTPSVIAPSGARDQLRRGHRQFRPAQLARHASLMRAAAASSSPTSSSPR
jgi:hypothetical protein